MDSEPGRRRVRDALIAGRVTGRVIAAWDQWRIRRLAVRGGLLTRSKTRWRESGPDAGLTWGQELDGRAAGAALLGRGVFGPGRSVLEVGPGYGRIIAACLDAGAEFDSYLGLDLSEQNVGHLRAEFSDQRLRFSVGDVETVSLEEPVDAVFSFLTFKHLYPTFEAALSNLAPQVRPGGEVIFDLLEGTRAYFHADQTSFVRYYTRDEAGQIVGNAGLTLAELGTVKHAPGRERLLVVARRPQ